jgi:hypothetical protein
LSSRAGKSRAVSRSKSVRRTVFASPAMVAKTSWYFAPSSSA